MLEDYPFTVGWYEEAPDQGMCFRCETLRGNLICMSCSDVNVSIWSSRWANFALHAH